MSRTKQRKKSSKGKVTGCKTVTVWRRLKGRVSKTKGKNKRSCVKKSRKK